MLQLDHISVIAPSLAEGVAHVRTCLDIDVPFGRRHEDMGTYNHLLRLGDSVYLEIIAANPDAPPPLHPRWFGLDDQRAVRAAWDSGLRLRGWVARTTDIDSVLARHEGIFGKKTRLTRGGSVYFFSIPPDGSLPLGGVAPSLIDREGRPPSIAAMADFGAKLRSLLIEHPDPDQVAELYGKLSIDTPPEVRHGERLRYRAMIDTRGGLRELS
jgi:Glyoxalase-like domain